MKVNLRLLIEIVIAKKSKRNNLIVADLKKQNLVRRNYGSVCKNYGLVCKNYSLVGKNHGPVRKKHDM